MLAGIIAVYSGVNSRSLKISSISCSIWFNVNPIGATDSVTPPLLNYLEKDGFLMYECYTLGKKVRR